MHTQKARPRRQYRTARLEVERAQWAADLQACRAQADREVAEVSDYLGGLSADRVDTFADALALVLALE